MSAYAPGAPAIVWAIDGVSDGAKLLLLHWWSKADHETQRSPRPCTVWAHAAEHEDGTRMSPAQSLLEDARTVHPSKADRTIRGYFRELRAAGLAEVDGRCVDLTPPDLATPRQDPATDRQKSAGKNLPRPGEILPTSGENPPQSGKNQPPQLYPPVPQDPPTVSPGTSTPEPDPLDAVFAEHGDLLTECPGCDRETEHVTLGADRVQCSGCGRVGEREHKPENQPAVAVETGPSDVLQPSANGPAAEARNDGPGHAGDLNSQPAAHPNPPTAAAPIEPEPPPPSPPPAKRKRKAAPPRSGQAALELGTEPEAMDVVAELLELHGRLRAEAQRHHGERVTELPGPGTSKGGSMRKGLKQAVKQRGEAWCRQMLEWRGKQWQRDASQLEYSAHNVWTRTSVDIAADRMRQEERRAGTTNQRTNVTIKAPPPSGTLPRFEG